MVKILDFDPIFVKQILEKKKTTTIRKGIKDFKEGDRVYIMSQGKIFAEAEITKVEVKQLFKLTDEDAKRDGFLNVEELINGLKKYYESVKPDDVFTIIHFNIIATFLSPEEVLQTNDEEKEKRNTSNSE
ncbi:MAG: ASCH domain-containing protein [Candidatus Baldrarchaeia archaeon]